MNDACPLPANAERIAFRSTQGDGQFRKDRWTEIAVHYLPGAASPFRCDVTGKSERDNEVDRAHTTEGATLATVLRIGLDDWSSPARSVRDQALAWAERNAERLAADAVLNLPFTGTTDKEALEWLYGTTATRARGFIGRVASDFGLPESTVRLAIANETGVRVPLATVAGMMDRTMLRSIKAAARG